MAALCKAPTKSASIGLSITAVCKNAGKKTLGQDDFFVVVSQKFKLICIDEISDRLIKSVSLRYAYKL